MKKRCAKVGCDASEYEVNNFERLPHVLLCTVHFAAFSGTEENRQIGIRQVVARARLDAAIQSGDCDVAELEARVYGDTDAAARAHVTEWCATPDAGAAVAAKEGAK